MRRATKFWVISVLVSLLFAQCSSNRMLHSEVMGSIHHLLDVDTGYSHVIATDDKISISIWGHQDLSVGSIFTIYNSNEAFGKWLLVDKAGTVQLPKYGTFILSGLTELEAAEKITTVLEKEVLKPIVVVKVLNRQFSVFGEVKKPGTYLLEKQRTTLIEALGLAEGFTEYANMKEVRVVREDISYSVDLSQLSPHYLHSIIILANDVIIVSPQKRKALDQKAPTLIPFSSALTAVVLFLSLINR